MYLSLRQLSKSFEVRRPALAPLDLDIAQGERWAILGTSGSGKTTLLRLIAGLEVPTTGSILREGKDIAGHPPQARGVAMHFQRACVVPAWSVRDNLAWAVGLNRRRPSPGRVEEMAERLELTPLLGKRCEQLSGGQQQRVALGRALLQQAPLTLLDEPLAHLETPLAFRLGQQLRLLAQQGSLTMVYVTHQAAEALAFAEKIAIFHEGRLLQAGEVHTIRQAPRHRAVAEALGSYLFLTGQVQAHEGELSFIGPWGRWQLPRSLHGAKIQGLRTLAVRPGSPGQAGDAMLPMRLLYPKDPLTEACWVCEYAGQRMSVVGEPGASPGSERMMAIALDDALVFDGATGESLVGSSA